ncbi:exonuclease 3'-5' domain-containing protein 2-like [Procambarus clarkii]|uniref:exonuclease 3'-5' domain-containing protein 2-like n=1 Tax=Procambarus clarkii TaxID=6728 RepID=UPI003742006B
MTNNWIREHPALISSILLGVGSTGMLLFHRKAIVQKICSWRLVRSVKAAERTVHVVTCEEGWAKVQPLLLREAQQDGAVGFDCEWVQAKGHRRPVALLQLAACSGLCILLRLSHMKPNFPNTLKSFLEDKTILKVGVGSLEDSNFLAADYNLKVRGCVDLRYLVLQCQETEPTCANKSTEGAKSKGGMGLNALAQKYLGRTLDKDWRVRASDWEAETLTRRQERYAAEDALVGVHILMVLMERLWVSSSPLVPFLPPTAWHQHLSTAVHHTCQGLIDVRFSNKQQDTGTFQNSQPCLPLKQKVSTRGHPVRKGPLYYNCQLRAPDDEPLCTIDPNKAQWYVEKGLGDLVSEEPLVVRLKFEPAGRPQTEKDDGMFYLQKRKNICVVCGKDESYIRKNVVPHEYRKHFPAILKHHQNHDVLLLCFSCHRQSNMQDNIFRSELAKEFNAPIGIEQNFKVAVDNSHKFVRNAARALLKNRDNIPAKKVSEMEKLVKDFYKVDVILSEHLQDAANIDVNVLNDGFQAHGQKIYDVYEKIGLVKLEQRWRQHFLDNMKPQFMPECWSVKHNVYKMGLKMGRLPLDHPNRLIYKMALVGSEGTIDIPYTPRSSQETMPLDHASASKSAPPEHTVQPFQSPTNGDITFGNPLTNAHYATSKNYSLTEEAAVASSHNESSRIVVSNEKGKITAGDIHAPCILGRAKSEIMEVSYSKLHNGEIHNEKKDADTSEDSDADVVIEDVSEEKV